MQAVCVSSCLSRTHAKSRLYAPKKAEGLHEVVRIKREPIAGEEHSRLTIRGESARLGSLETQTRCSDVSCNTDSKGKAGHEEQEKDIYMQARRM